jgi:hypothetical protein
MAEEISKQAPGAAPSPPGELEARVGPAGTAPKDPSGIRIRLEVSGGNVEERYEFKFELSGSGEMATSLRDRMRNVEKDARGGKLAQKGVARLLRGIDVRRLAGMARPARPIPPDSVVGRLTIGYGGEEVRAVFMADRGQAEAVGMRLDPALEEMVKEIYRLAARQLKVKDMRP